MLAGKPCYVPGPTQSNTASSSPTLRFNHSASDASSMPGSGTLLFRDFSLLLCWDCCRCTTTSAALGTVVSLACAHGICRPRRLKPPPLLNFPPTNRRLMGSVPLNGIKPAEKSPCCHQKRILTYFNGLLKYKRMKFCRFAKYMLKNYLSKVLKQKDFLLTWHFWSNKGSNCR